MESTPKYTENYTTNQLVLPLNLGIKLRKDSEVYTYLELTKGIRMEKYFGAPSGKGRHRKNRVQILNAILFGFMVDVRSTRAIEKACQNDIRFMYLIDGIEAPSHTLINDVMNEIGEKLDYLFKEVNETIMRKEDLDTNKLYIDGTKIEADANKYSFKWKKSIIKHRNKLYKKVSMTLQKLNPIYESHGYKPVKETNTYSIKVLTKMVNRLVGIIDYNGIELVYGKGHHKSEIQRLYDQISGFLDKLREYEKDLSIIGPKRNSYAKTDHDATFMHMKEDHMRNAQLKPGYNVQIGVSNEYIMVIDAFQNGSDFHTFKPLLEKYNLMYNHYPIYPVADAGYGSYDNYSYCIEKGMALYQKYGMWEKERTKKHKNNIFHQDNFRIDKFGNYRCPRNKKMIKTKTYKKKTIKYDHQYTEYTCERCGQCRLKKQCTKAQGDRTITVLEGYKTMKSQVNKNLNSSLGIELRTQRSIQVEGAFGVIKEDMKFRRFTRTLFSGIKLELNLIAIGYNLKKFHNKQYRG